MSRKNKFNVGDVVIVKSWDKPPFLAVLADAGERRKKRVRVINHELDFNQTYLKESGIDRLYEKHEVCPQIFHPTPENLAAMNHLYGTNLTL